MNNKFSRHKINGNGLKSNTFKRLLEASYSGEEEVEGFVLDKSIYLIQVKYIFIQAVTL